MTATRNFADVIGAEMAELRAADPARLAAMAVISAAGLNVAGADLDAAAAAMRRELDVAELQGRAKEVALRDEIRAWLRGDES